MLKHHILTFLGMNIKIAPFHCAFPFEVILLNIYNSNFEEVKLKSSQPEIIYSVLVSPFKISLLLSYLQ